MIVTVYYRADSSAANTVNQVLDRLADLSAAGRGEKFRTISVVPRQVLLDMDEGSPPEFETLQTISRKLGAPLAPAREISQRDNQFTVNWKNVTAMLIFTIVVADARNDEPLAMAPTQTGSGHRNGGDLLNWLVAEDGHR